MSNATHRRWRRSTRSPARTTRDENFARDFLTRHRDKLLFGSDCNDRDGGGPECLGAEIVAAIRRLAPNRQVERRLLYENAKSVFRL